MSRDPKHKPGIPGFDVPYPSYDPLGFLVDDEIREFELDHRWDLTAVGAEAAPTLSTGIFIVHEHVVPKGTGEVIYGVHPHCWRRENAGSAAPPPVPGEVLQVLDPRLIAGAVLFDVTKDNNQPLLVETNYNLPAQAGSGVNRSRQPLRGSTWLYENGALGRDTMLTFNRRTYFLPGGSVFRVLFRLMPQPAANGQSDPWVIPNYEVGSNTQNRIDAAGALVVGMRMPQQVYEKLKIARRVGLLGAEAAGFQR